MKRKNKMNGLYKAAFIILLVCLLMLIASVVVAYAFNRPKISAIISVSGVFLAFLGIILSAVSKPKSKENSSENQENPIDKQM